MSSHLIRDIKDLSSIEINSVTELISKGFSKHQGTIQAWSEGKITSELSEQMGLVLFENSTPQAVILYRQLPDAILEITWLNSSPSFLRRGNMSKLIEEFINRNQASETWLEVNELNIAAIALYKRIGFQESGRRANYYSPREDAVMFTFKPKS